MVFAIVGAMATSAVLTWLLRVLSDRLTRRFRDRVTIALETHVATLQASVSGLELQERSDYLDRLSVLRNQVFVLDHMYLSVLNTLGWLIRVAVTLALLASIHPVLLLLALFAVPDRGQRLPAAGRGAPGRGTVRRPQPARRAPVHHSPPARRRPRRSG